MTANVHATAVVDPAAQLGEGVNVGPYAVIGPKARLGARCQVGPHCVIENVRAGEDNRFNASVFAGTPPQDIRNSGDEFFVVIGKGNTFRECVTLNRGTKSDTLIGDGCFVMAYAHVAHDCRVGNGVILVNNATLAGHVQVEDGAILSGFAAAHQFCRVGRLAMVSGLSGVVLDIPPFCTATGTRAELAGLNLVGMRRGGVPKDSIRQVREAYKTLFLRNLPLAEALARVRATNPCPEVGYLIAFIEASKRGVARPRLVVGESTEEAAEV